MKIYLGSDHRGFFLKEKVKDWLYEWGYDFEDLGALELNPKDDYTRYSEAVASKVSLDSTSRGILFCGSGVGVDVVANKFDGIRASVGKLEDQVEAGRMDDDMNVLVLASDYTTEKEAKGMVKIFLVTEFSGEERHKKRLRDISEIEANN